MQTNHLATNLVTKGLLNISNITKGMIILQFEVVFKKRHGGGMAGDGVSIQKPPLYYDSKETLFRELPKLIEEDIDVIKVYVNWNKSSYKGSKKFEAKLMKTQIEAEILNETGKSITVEIL
jgi:hypothetical protein